MSVDRDFERHARTMRLMRRRGEIERVERQHKITFMIASLTMLAVVAYSLML